jgi:hypothetical protein
MEDLPKKTETRMLVNGNRIKQMVMESLATLKDTHMKEAGLVTVNRVKV